MSADFRKNKKVKKLAQLLSNLEGDISAKSDISVISKSYSALEKKWNSLQKANATRMAKKSSGYNMEQFYTTADRDKLVRLQNQLDQAVAKANGDLRDYRVVSAQADLADFTVQLGKNYVHAQPALPDLMGLTSQQVKAAMTTYLGEAPQNPHIWIAEDLTKLTSTQKLNLKTAQKEVQEAWNKLQTNTKEIRLQKAYNDASLELDRMCRSLPQGAVKKDYAFGKEVGGAYSYLRSDCEALSLKLAGYGLNVSWEELSLIARYCHGSNFVNHYCFGIGSIHNCINPVIKRQLTKLVENYMPAINSVMGRMPRYNGVTYRGVDIWPEAINDPSKDGFWNSIMQAWNSLDKIWTTPNPTSSTLEISAADIFANGVMNAPKGQRVIMKIRGTTGVDVHEISPYGNEAEIMFRANSKFRMLKAPYMCTQPGVGKVGDWVVELEEIL